MCSKGPDCKKLCTVAALSLKSEQIRKILPKPGSGKTWIKGWGDVPDSPFSLESDNRKAEKVNLLSRLGYLVPGAGIEPAHLSVGDFESYRIPSGDADFSSFLAQ